MELTREGMNEGVVNRVLTAFARVEARFLPLAALPLKLAPAAPEAVLVAPGPALMRYWIFSTITADVPPPGPGLVTLINA